MTQYADIADHPEWERIQIIGRMAESGRVVGYVVETNQKADLYLKKLLAQYKVRFVSRGPGPIVGTILVMIGQAES